MSCSFEENVFILQRMSFAFHSCVVLQFTVCDLVLIAWGRMKSYELNVEN